MDNKTYRMLELLDNSVQKCTECNLYSNGRGESKWTKNSKYVMVLDTPGSYTNREFWDVVSEYFLTKSDFLTIHSVSCYCLKGKKNMIPSELHRDRCRKWIRKYIQVLQPEKMILMGNSAIHTLTGKWGVSKIAGEITECYGIETILSYPPSSIRYNENSIRKCIQQLGE